MGEFVYEIAVPASENGSPPARGGKSPYVVYGSDDRGKQYYDDRSRLAVGRTSSMKEHRRAASVHVGDSRERRDRSRPRSTYYSGGGADRYDDDYQRRGRSDKVYYGREYYAESNYSGSSHDSRDNSPHRGYHRHHRTPSAHSEMGYNGYDAPYPPGPGGQPAWGPPVPPPPGMGIPPHPGMAMTLAGPPLPPHMAPNQPLMTPGSMVPWQPPPQISPEQEELNKKIEALQLELKKSKEESEKIQKTKEEQEAQRKKKEELEAAVKREIEAREAAEKKAREAAAAEAARIKAEAERLLAEQKAAAEAAAKKEADEKAKLEAIVNLRLLEEKQKENQVKENQMVLDLRKPTHTKFSKTHLCKEALDERKISYTEHEDSFLVHRWVDREEQNQLWARTKQIRAYQLEYQKRFKEEADKAPVIDTPNGPVKIVRVGNNPPVTVPVVLVTKKAPVVEDVKFRHIFGMR